MVGAVSVRYSFIELDRSTTMQMSRSKRTTVAELSGWKSTTLNTRPKKVGTLPDGAFRVRRPNTRTALMGSPCGTNAQAPFSCCVELPNTISCSSSSNSGVPATRFNWAMSMAACRDASRSCSRDKASPAARAAASVAARSRVRQSCMYATSTEKMTHANSAIARKQTSTTTTPRRHLVCWAEQRGGCEPRQIDMDVSPGGSVAGRWIILLPW